MVQYVDYRTEAIPEGSTFYEYLHKRKFFAYERELRAIYRIMPFGTVIDFDAIPSEPGVVQEVDLTSLIEHIYVSPKSRPWYKKLVEGILKKYSLDIPVKQSSLDDKPYS